MWAGGVFGSNLAFNAWQRLGKRPESARSLAGNRQEVKDKTPPIVPRIPDSTLNPNPLNP